MERPSKVLARVAFKAMWRSAISDAATGPEPLN